jgi:NADPH:quinone reductase-like Zn-dependent oxidoreductase
MRAVLQRGFGGPEVLEVADVDDPVPAHGEVVVAVRAAALNRLDVQQRAGPAVIPGFSLPHIAGMDVAGEVVELGPGVGTVALGARVVVDPAIPCGTCPACLAGDGAFCPSMAIVGANRPGGFAERCVVPATSVHLVPDHVGLAEAATLPTAWGTAWHALFTTGAVAAGETLLVHAAASGVSLAAIQLAKAAGLRVIATSRSEDRLAVAAGSGSTAPPCRPTPPGSSGSVT